MDAAERDPIAKRLIQAAAEEIAGHGAATASARAIARAAGSSPSAINYNFDGIEHLFRAAFASGAVQTAAWLDERAQEIAALPATPAGAVMALEHVIAEWTSGARTLALLYQETLAEPAGAAPALDWARLWRDFWACAAGSFGLSPAEGRLMHAFFESEALYHLSAWSPALERAALRELCGGFGFVFLGAPRQAPTGATALAERKAGALPVDAVAPAAFKVIQAAAAVVEERGLGGLTHRAVAARAGVSTGSVTHHFRTIGDLVAGAIRGEVLAMSEDGLTSPSESIASPDALFETIARYAVTERPWGPSLRRRQLFLTALRRPDLAGAAAVIRFAHGGTVGATLERLFLLSASERSLYAGLLARLISGSWFATAADPAPIASQAALVEAVRRGFMRAFANAARSG